MALDRSLRSSFDGVAERYDEARPGYPDALYEDVLSLSGLPAGGQILEIGCGPGTATIPFARRGYAMVCLELGANLAERARLRCRPFPDVEIRHTSFEDWPLESAAFDLVASASAFHWIPPDIGYAKAAAALRDGGSIALFWNRYPGFPAPVREALHAIYREEAPQLVATGRPSNVEEIVRRTLDEIDASNAFGTIVVRRYPWVQTYTAEGYVRLLQTYSDHIALPDDVRRRLTDRVRAFVEASGGTVERPYLSVLYWPSRDGDGVRSFLREGGRDGEDRAAARRGAERTDPAVRVRRSSLRPPPRARVRRPSSRAHVPRRSP